MVEKMRRWYYLIFLLLLTGCGQAPAKEEGHVLRIEVNKDVEPLPLDSIFGRMEYIPLETTDSSLLSGIDRVRVYDSLFYILDRKQAVIEVFDGKGNFCRKLDRKGRAPGEYLSLEDFCIHDTLVYVLSSASKKIFVYNREFEFVEDIRVNAYATNLEYCDAYLYLFNNFCSDDLNNYYVIDPVRKKIVNKFSPFLEKQRGVAYIQNNLSVYQHKVYSFLSYGYGIYALSPDRFEEVMQLDFGKENMWPSDFMTYSDEERKAYLKRYSSRWDFPVNGLHVLYMDDNRLYFSFTKGITYHYFCMKNTGDVYLGLLGPSRAYPLMNNTVVYMNERYCLLSITPDAICNLKEKTGILPPCLQSVQIEDNPALGLAYWKNR